MILVDTSAWIASFKKAGNHDLKEFMKQAIVSGHAATSPIILLELLQGCRTVEERDSLRIKLESLDILPITPGVWEQAYELGFSLRRKGLTIPTVGYRVKIIFLYLPDVAIAMERIRVRVKQGGHYIPQDVIRRRYKMGWKNFQEVYKDLVDAWVLYDNSGEKPVLLDVGGKQ